jgi:hypothetical protein
VQGNHGPLIVEAADAGAVAALRTAIALSSAVRQLAEAGLRMRHPGASDQELRVRLAVRLYGRAAAVRLFATVPDDAV